MVLLRCVLCELVWVMLQLIVLLFSIRYCSGVVLLLVVFVTMRGVCCLLSVAVQLVFACCCLFNVG